MAGFRRALADHPGIRLVGEADGRWSTAQSEKAMAGLLAQEKAAGGIDAVYAMADNMAAGVIRAIEAAGLDAGSKGHGIVVVSSGCMKDGVDNIRAGKEFGTDAEIPAHDAKLAAETIATYLAGGRVAQYTYVRSHRINKANLEDYARLCSY